MCRCGFKGTIYAGFRGDLPPWAEKSAKPLPGGHTAVQVTPDVRLVFIPLKTSAHLTNYKPDFMLQIEALTAAESDGLIYIDPDIVLDVDWGFIEDWVSCGVAVCADVNSPLDENHPSRVGWRRFFKQYGHHLQFRTTSYANGGFIGLTWNYRKLLPLWQEFMTHIGELLGGKDVVGIQGGKYLEKHYGFANCFSKTDQDAMNAILEASPDIPISFLGHEAMGFRAGHAILPHALGITKPWNRRYLMSLVITGTAPTRVDKLYWTDVEGPLKPFSPAHISSIRTQLALCSTLGRLIRRN